jgi:hypothetical protein
MLILLPMLMAAGNIDLINDSGDALTLRFTLPAYTLAEAMVEGLKLQRIMMDEGMPTSDEGFPELRMFSVPVAIPIDGAASARVLSANSNSFSDIRIHPVPTMHVIDGERSYELQRDYAAYARANLYPAGIVEISEPAFVGDRRFVSLRIFPFQYVASRQELIVHQEIEISVSIMGTKSPSKDWQLGHSPVDGAADAFFVNNASSKTWRLPRRNDYHHASPKNSTNQVSEIQLIVDAEGIYKVTYEELKTFIQEQVQTLELGMSWNIDQIDPRFLELSDEFGQIPIHFHGEEDGSFDSGDYFEFFGDRHYGEVLYYDDFTAENVYTLALMEGYGARMVVENGGLTNSDPLQYRLADAYEETVHFEQQLVSDKLGRGWTSLNPEFYREDVWFWKKINAPNLEIVPIELQYPVDSAIRKANTKFVLYGLTYKENLVSGEYDHEATIRLNQAMVNTHTWIGQTEKIFYNQEEIPNSFLRHGTNHAYISLSGNTASGNREQVLLDNIEISYWRQYKTDQDFMKFTKPKDRPNGLYQFNLEGFSSPNVSVYKIGSSKFSSMQIEPFTVDGTAPWTVSLQDSVSSQAVRYYAVEEGSKKKPKLMRMNIPSDLKNPMNSANVILITPYEFLQAEGTLLLKDVWQSEGHTVKTVDIQDIYDEFNGGIVSAESIRDFLKHAYEYWSAPRLSHVVLLGEGIDDTRDNSPSRKYNLIPVKKTWTYKHGATASDNWYACLVGNDTVPDISLARINIWTAQQILDYATKALSYRTNLHTNRLWNNHITFTAGGKISDGNDVFAQQSERIRRKSVPTHYRVKRVYTTTQSVSNDFRGGTFELKDAINSGTQFVQFMGHGGGRVWADYNLFNFNDVATLNNQAYPVFLSLACYASAFDTNGNASISEALVAAPNKGAIATVGFSGLGYLEQDEGWGLAFNEAAFKHDFPSLGEAYAFALARFYTTTSSSAARYALTHGSAYLGDPLIRFNKPTVQQGVSLENHNPEPGETLIVNAEFPQSVTRARLYVMDKNEIVRNVPFDINVENGSYTATYNVPQSTTNYTNRIMVAGYSPTKTFVGTSSYGVGRPAITHEAFIPAQPVYSDSTGFTARVFSTKNIINMYVSVRTDSSYNSQTQLWSIIWENYPMAVNPEDGTLWTSTAKLRKLPTAREYPFKYYMKDEDNVTYESPVYMFQVAGPDLFLRDIVFEPNEGNPFLKVKSTNVGNAASITTDLRLFLSTGQQVVLHSTQDFAPLEVDEERWDVVSLAGVPNGNMNLEVRVNTTGVFQEWHLFVNTNNYISIDVPMNYFMVDSSGGTISSLDGNLNCSVPAGFVPSGSMGMAINSIAEIPILNQPDIKQIMLEFTEADSLPKMSTPFEIKMLSSTLADSLGFFAGGKRLELTFMYNSMDPLTQAYETENSYKIYRYNDEYQKWILLGGHVSTQNNTVNFEISREGIYTIFRNLDAKAPSVDVNVQDQEFTVGGYVAGDGVISLLLSDANGIDVIDNSIRLFLNGNEVPETDYVISINKENINQIPIKYQLDLKKGNHELKIDCRDLNGNFTTREVQFVVNDHFDIKNIGNYPNPVLGHAEDPKNDGRTRFTFVLTDTADEVYIKVYTISGRLVKTFRNLPTGVGYHEYPRTVYAWDCKDDQGYPLANGTYFYRVVARRGGKKIEKTMKMAILR